MISVVVVEDGAGFGDIYSDGVGWCYGDASYNDGDGGGRCYGGGYSDGSYDGEGGRCYGGVN